MKIVKEFKEFIMRGSVLDMAVGVVIGGAFTAIVNSLVDDVIMPVVGKLTAGIDFKQLAIPLGGTDVDGVPVTINIGLFINAIITFLIVALAIFLLIKGVNKLRAKSPEEEQEEPAGPTEVELLQELLNEVKAAKGKAIDTDSKE